MSPSMLRNGPVNASEKEITRRADQLVSDAEQKDWVAKEAVLAWMCASGNVVARLSDDMNEVARIGDWFLAYFKRTVMAAARRQRKEKS